MTIDFYLRTISINFLNAYYSGMELGNVFRRAKIRKDKNLQRLKI